MQTAPWGEDRKNSKRKGRITKHLSNPGRDFREASQASKEKVLTRKGEQLKKNAPRMGLLENLDKIRKGASWR